MSSSAAGAAAMQGARRSQLSALSLPTDQLIGWWEPREATVNGSGHVTALADKSGAGNDLAASAVGAEMTLAADADYGGQNVLVMPSASKHLFRSAFVGGVEAQPTTVLFLGEITSYGSSAGYFFDGEGSRNAVFWDNAGGGTQFGGGSYGIGTLPLNSPVPGLFVFNGASSSARVSSSWASAGATGNAGTSGMNGIRLGARTTGNVLLIGRIAVSAVWGKALDAAEIDQARTYLNAEFGQSITV